MSENGNGSGNLPARVEHEAPADIVSVAVAQGMDAETIGKLITLANEREDRQARQAYIKAMAAFRREAPAVLHKDAAVSYGGTSGTNYRHTTLGAAVGEVVPIMSRHGLTHSWHESQEKEGCVTVACTVTHEQGHGETTSLTAPRDNSGKKNPVQQLGSTVTYLQRYTLLSLLGLATADMDDDGRGKVRGPGEAGPKGGRVTG